MIIFIRHAERGDNQLPMKLSEISYDPPIIDAAQQTISNSLTGIIQLLKVHQIKNIKICSSKFLRCIMTAKGLEQGLLSNQFNVDKEFTLDDRISQFLREDWFESYPLNNLIYQTEHLSKYVANLKYQEKVVNLPFPENYPKFHHRVTAFKKQLNFPDKNSCLLIVTHGFVVRELCFRMHQLPLYQNQVKYCGYAAYVREQEKGQKLIEAKL